MHAVTGLLQKYKIGEILSAEDYIIVEKFFGETSLWYNLSSVGKVVLFCGKSGKYGKGLFATNGVKKPQPLLLKMLARHEKKAAGKPPTDPVKAKESRAKLAFRKAIKSQVDQCWNNTTFPHSCPLSGKIFYSSDRHLVHVDHRSADSYHHPFSTILRLFLLSEQLELKDISLNIQGNLKSDLLVSKWQKWHQTYADLVPVCKEYNLAKGAKRDDSQSFWGN
jgi:hypothetical protein